MESDMVQHKTVENKARDELKDMLKDLERRDRDEVLEEIVLYAARRCKKVRDIVSLIMNDEVMSNTIRVDEILNTIKRLENKNLVLYNSNIRSFKDYIGDLYLSFTLWLTIIITSLTLITIYILPDIVPWSIIRLAIGSAFVLFIPGYTLLQLLFPRKESSYIEKIAVSIGLSLAIIPFIGLLLNYSPWGIRLDPIIVSIGITSVALAFASIYRKYIINKI